MRENPGRLLVAVLAVSAVWALCGCQQEPERPNVLVLTLDTTRADYIGCYGSPDANTPNLDAFARDRAVLFEEAITVAPLTLPAHTSILTGTYPVFHGVHDNDGFYVADDITTIAEILAAAGYTTGAVVGAFPVDSQFNLDQGFATYDDNYQSDWTPGEVEARTASSFGFVERRADQVNRAATRWFEDHLEEPFLLWIHYFDPHQPYDPPTPYNSMYANRYQGEIAFVDECFGTLVADLDRRGLTDRTIIVVVGDHAEALEEHGEPTHGTYLYDATMRVPLLIAAPQPWVARGQTVTAQVSVVDIVPTLLDLLGLQVPAEVQGRSLAGALRDPDSLESGPILLESHFGLYHFGWAPLRALRTGSWKYILAPLPELYDLEKDPGELDNLIGSRPEVAARLASQLDGLASDLTWPDPGRSAAISIDSDVRQRLEALGYVSGGGPALRAQAFPTLDELARLPNPIDGALALHYINVTSELIRNRRYDLAVSVSRRGLAVDPENHRLQYTLAFALFGNGQLKEALVELERVVRTNPSDAAPHVLIGRIHALAGQFDLARDSFAAAVELEPNRIDALNLLGFVEAKLGDLTASTATLRRALAVDSGSWQTHLRLGRVLADAGRADEARDELQMAMHLNPYSAEVLGTIGVFYMQLGNLDFARQALEQALRAAPDDPWILVHLAEVLLRMDAEEDTAREHLERVVNVAPDSPWASTAQRYLEGLAETAPTR